MPTTMHPCTRKTQQSKSIRQNVRSLLARSLATLHLWQQRRHGRRDLLGLHDRLLRDIGLSRAEAERERANRSGDPECQPLGCL
jgi:uncharacterized protein YjiS (DUF1127 family)